jgi:hypothetical protein
LGKRPYRTFVTVLAETIIHRSRFKEEEVKEEEVEFSNTFFQNVRPRRSSKNPALPELLHFCDHDIG